MKPFAIMVVFWLPLLSLPAGTTGGVLQPLVAGCARIPSMLDVGYCGVPYWLSNFQGIDACTPAVRMVRPKTVQDIQTAVASFSKVKAIGTGLSWHQELFCSGTDQSAANIAMTELSNLQQLFQRNTQFLSFPTGPDFPIVIDYGAMTVTADAGVPLRTLLLFLANQRTPQCPQGCYLPNTPQMIDQTVAGAVSTGTHGSGAQFASMPSQVVRLEAVLADGTLRTFTPGANPHLFRAMQVSAGRLGIITKVTFVMVPQQLLRRTRTDITPQAMVARIVALQQTYKDAVASGNPQQLQAFLDSIKNFLVLWFQPLDQVWWIEVQPAAATDRPTFNETFAAVKSAAALTALETLLRTKHAISLGTRVVFAPPPSTDAQKINPSIPRSPILQQDSLARLICAGFQLLISYGLSSTVAPPYFTLPTTRPEWLNIWAAGTSPMQELEVCVPFEVAGDAITEVFSVAKPLKNKFRTPSALRFMNTEEGYLELAQGGPRLCIVLDDWTGGGGAEALARVMLKYRGRLHLGKYGFTTLQPCFDGAAAWGDSWCQFGCAVQELDPGGKFASTSTIWTWTAADRGTGTVLADFSTACTAAGFDTTNYVCAARPPCA